MPKILVVDDEEDMRATLAILLEAEGYGVVTATNGHGAVERIRKDSIDMVVSDIRMPDMDGIELLQQVKDINPTIPVVMVTGYGSAELAVESMKLGAFDYLQKPFDNDRFYEVVRAALSHATLQRSAVKGGVVEQRLSQKLAPRSRGGAEAARPAPSAKPAPSTPTASVPIASDEPGGPPTWFWASVVALVFALIGTGFWVKGRINWGTKKLAVETANLSGLTVGDPSEIWVCDWMAATISRFQVEVHLWVPSSLKKLAQYTLTGRQLTGITMGPPDTIFTCDAISQKIYEHRLDAGLTVKNEVPSPGPAPSGLFWDGKYLWSVDAQNHRIYRHNYDPQLTVVNQFDSPGKHPVGLGTDGETIWTADAEDKLLYQHQPGEGFTVVGKYRLPGGAPERLASFARDKEHIWISSEGSNTLLVIQPGALIPVK